LNLSDYGFAEVGEWKTDLKLNSSIRHELSSPLRKARVIYAFEAEDEVKYIGICEEFNTTLENRMDRYQSQAGGTTNKRIANEIGTLLEDGKPVKIFALRPEPVRQYVDLTVDMVRGLEKPLIEKFNPPWNIKGRG
jgi:hypothetical protein